MIEMKDIDGEPHVIKLNQVNSMNSYSPFSKHCINGDDQMTTTVNQFEDNYHGILTHNGEIKVAKCDVEQTILHIDDNGTVLVKGREKAYVTQIHAKLLSLMHYAAEGDIGFVKFRRGEAYIVGFRKTKGANKNV